MLQKKYAANSQWKHWFYCAFLGLNAAKIIKRAPSFPCGISPPKEILGIYMLLFSYRCVLFQNYLPSRKRELGEESRYSETSERANFPPFDMGTRMTEWFPFWCFQQINAPTRLHPAGHTSPKWFIKYFHIFYIGKDQVRLQLPLAVFSEEKVTQNRVVATTRIRVMLDCHTVSLLPGNLPWNSKIITTKEKRSQLEKQCETLTERAGYSISK